MTITITHSAASGSLWEKLTAELGRQPTNDECRKRVHAICEAALIETAGKGKLPHQRRR